MDNRPRHFCFRLVFPLSTILFTRGSADYKLPAQVDQMFFSCSATLCVRTRKPREPLMGIVELKAVIVQSSNTHLPFSSANGCEREKLRTKHIWKRHGCKVQTTRRVPTVSRRNELPVEDLSRRCFVIMQSFACRGCRHEIENLR